MKHRILLSICILFISTTSVLSFTLYSRGNTGFFTSGTWSKIACGGISCGCTPAAGDNIIICSGYTVTLPVGLITVGPGGNCASITIQSGGTLNMLATGEMLVKNGGILTIAAGGALLVNNFTNNNNSDGVTINGMITVTGAFSNGVGADIIGSGSIDWTGATYVNNGTVFGSGSPLPIELLSFKANVNQNKVNLEWITATETNNDYFTIEKTKDGSNFESAGIVDGAGNSSSTKNYSFFDSDPYEGLSYYRLKQTDYNGDFTYSQSIAVTFNATTEFSFEVFPNPNSGENINFLLNSEKDKEVLVVVYDVSGKESYSKVIITSTNGENVYAFDPSNKLSPGVYLITATSQQNIYSKRLIVK